MNLRIKLPMVLILGLLFASCKVPLSDDQVAGTLSIPPPQVTRDSPLTSNLIVGRVWHDLCAAPSDDQPLPPEPPEGCIAKGGIYLANGDYEQTEPGIQSLVISLGKGACPSRGLAEMRTNSKGVFTFLELDAGVYCLSVDPSQSRNSEILLPGVWSTDQGSGIGTIALTVTLNEGEALTHFEFGWDYQFLPPYFPSLPDTSEGTDIPATITPTLPPQMTSTPEAPVTPQTTDPDLPSGELDYLDLFANPGNWFDNLSLDEDDHARFEVKGGKMLMTAFNADSWQSWRLSWPNIEDFYLEGNFETGDCSGYDRYGLFVRGEKVAGNVHGYLFGVSCNGQYFLKIFDDRSESDGSYSTLIDWTSSAVIQSGADKRNRLGFWAKGDQLRLYINGERLAEIKDDTFNAGLFGLFIGAAETENLIVEVDDIAYWLLP